MRFFVADTETIGLNPPKNGASGVVQVAHVEIDPETNLQKGELFSALCNPGAPIAEGASKVHGIYEDDIKDKPPLNEVLKLDGPIVLICHNAPFDLKFMGSSVENIVGSVCTLALSRQHYPNAPNHKLTTMVDFLGLEKGKAHDAGGDVFMCLQLLQHLLAKMAPRTLHQLVASNEQPKMLSIVPFGAHKGKSFVDMPRSYLEWVIANDFHQDMKYTAERILLTKG